MTTANAGRVYFGEAADAYADGMAAERARLVHALDASTTPVRCGECGTQLDRTAIADLLREQP